MLSLGTFPIIARKFSFSRQGFPISGVNFLGGWYPSAYYDAGKCNTVMGGVSLRWNGEHTFIYSGGSCPVVGATHYMRGRINKIGLHWRGVLHSHSPTMGNPAHIYSKIRTSWIQYVMWSRLHMPTCRYFYTMWFIHNCSCSLYNSN